MPLRRRPIQNGRNPLLDLSRGFPLGLPEFIGSQHREHICRGDVGDGLPAKSPERIGRERRPPSRLSLPAVPPCLDVHPNDGVGRFLERRHRRRLALARIAAGAGNLPIRLRLRPCFRWHCPLRRAESDFDALAVDRHPLNVGLPNAPVALLYVQIEPCVGVEELAGPVDALDEFRGQSLHLVPPETSNSVPPKIQPVVWEQDDISGDSGKQRKSVTH